MIPRPLALFARLALALALFGSLTGTAQADPADIDAAARGVVRVVVIARDGESVTPVSHGTGFAITPERVVTNAHVVREAMDNPNLSLGIVPSDGEDAVYARVLAISNRNDLALISTTSPMNLPPLTIAGNPATEAGSVTAVGYPMNVDRAQGLGTGDIFRAQPPVKSTGFLSGRRPSRTFDSLLHTAPIARGNSGGPLLDECGRVIGVNSFGAESGSADAEFFFAVSTRELLPFLRANDIAPRINALPCRSLADLDAAERDRAERAQLAARAQAEENAEELVRRQEEARRTIIFQVMEERENGFALTGLLLVVALGAGGFAFSRYERGGRQTAIAAASIASLSLLGAGAAWLMRPTYDEVQQRLDENLRREVEAETAGQVTAAASPGALMCMLDAERSRVTGAPAQDLPLEWRGDGCVNGRTQYALTDGEWTRVLVPSDEAVVSVNRFDPEAREYRVDRYLLNSEAIARARSARADYSAPQCGTSSGAAQAFSDQQRAVLSLLPASPNERLVYRCRTAQ